METGRSDGFRKLGVRLSSGIRKLGRLLVPPVKKLPLAGTIPVEGGCSCVAAAEDGSLIAAGNGTSFKVFDISGKQIFEVKLDAGASKVSAAAKGRYVSVLDASGQVMVYDDKAEEVVLIWKPDFQAISARLRPDGHVIAAANREAGKIHLMGVNGEDAGSPREVPGGWSSGHRGICWVEVAGEHHIGAVDGRRAILYNHHPKPYLEQTCEHRVWGFAAKSGIIDLLMTWAGRMRVVQVRDNKVQEDRWLHLQPAGFQSGHISGCSSGWLTAVVVRGSSLYAITNGDSHTWKVALPGKATDLALAELGMVLIVAGSDGISFYFNYPAAARLLLHGDDLERHRAERVLLMFGEDQTREYLSSVEAPREFDGVRSMVIQGVDEKLEVRRRQEEADLASEHMLTEAADKRRAIQQEQAEKERDLQLARQKKEVAEEHVTAIERAITNTRIRAGAYSARHEVIRRPLNDLAFQLRRFQTKEEELLQQVKVCKRQKDELEAARNRRAEDARQMGDTRIVDAIGGRIRTVENILGKKQQELQVCRKCIVALKVRRDEFHEEKAIAALQGSMKPFDCDEAQMILEGTDKAGQIIDKLGKLREADEDFWEADEQATGTDLKALPGVQTTEKSPHFVEGNWSRVEPEKIDGPQAP